MKFTIRDLFLVTVIVALALGWWIDHFRPGNISYRHLQRENLRLENRVRSTENLLKQYGWEVKKQEVVKGGWVTRFDRPNDDPPDTSPPAPNPLKP